MKIFAGSVAFIAALFAFNTAQAATAAADAPYVSPRFKALDADKDGKITLQEFVKDQIDDFNRRDENKDKTLSEDELDFPPGTPPQMKTMMRKQMQDQDLREQQMQAENKKRMEDDMKRMQAEQEKMRQQAQTAAKAAPAKAAPAATPAIPAAPAKPAAATAKPKAPETGRSETGRSETGR